MGNLYQDLVVDKSADLVIHAGDHGCERAGCLPETCVALVPSCSAGVSCCD